MGILNTVPSSQSSILNLACSLIIFQHKTGVDLKSIPVGVVGAGHARDCFFVRWNDKADGFPGSKKSPLNNITYQVSIFLWKRGSLTACCPMCWQSSLPEELMPSLRQLCMVPGIWSLLPRVRFKEK